MKQRGNHPSLFLSSLTSQPEPAPSPLPSRDILGLRQTAPRLPISAEICGHLEAVVGIGKQELEMNRHNLLALSTAEHPDWLGHQSDKILPAFCYPEKVIHFRCGFLAHIIRIVAGPGKMNGCAGRATKWGRSAPVLSRPYARQTNQSWRATSG